MMKLLKGGSKRDNGGGTGISRVTYSNRGTWGGSTNGSLLLRIADNSNSCPQEITALRAGASRNDVYPLFFYLIIFYFLFPFESLVSKMMQHNSDLSPRNYRPSREWFANGVYIIFYFSFTHLRSSVEESERKKAWLNIMAVTLYFLSLSIFLFFFFSVWNLWMLRDSNRALIHCFSLMIYFHE